MKPDFQPISKLPMMIQHVSGIRRNTQENKASVEQGLKRPYTLDDHTVQRIIKVYTEQIAILSFHEEQSALWKKENLKHQQKLELSQYDKLIGQSKKLTEEVLKIADELKDITIEKIMAKDDFSLALDVLSGKLKL